MKKKIFLFTIIIAVLAVVLAGCISKPPHKTFSDPWDNYEQITYDVTRTLKDGSVIKGVSVMTTERLTNQTINIGKNELQNFSGTVITIDTKLEDNSTMFAQVAFKPSFEPVASYKNIAITGHSGSQPETNINQTTDISYNNEKCYYSTNFDGVETNDEIKVGQWIKKPYYDNLMLYHIARSSYMNGKFTAISTKVLSVSDFKMKTLTVAQNKASAITPIFGESEGGILADEVKLTLNQTFPGTGAPMVVTLSKQTSEDYNGLKLSTDRIPLIIKEGDIEYKIKAYVSAQSAPTNN